MKVRLEYGLWVYFFIVLLFVLGKCFWVYVDEIVFYEVCNVVLKLVK